MFKYNRQDTDQNGVPVQTTSKTMISIHFPNSHIRELVECIFGQSQKTWDVLLKVGPDLREFKVHRTILSFASNFLSKLLLQTSVSNKDPVIILPEFDPNILECVLTYIYTGELNLSPENINGFIEVCTILEIKGIVDQQYKLLDLIETSNTDPTVEYETQNQRKEVDDNTMVPRSNPSIDEEVEGDTQNQDEFDENDVTMSEGDSLMEEEYVLEEDTTEFVNCSTQDPSDKHSIVITPQVQLPNPIIIPRVITNAPTTQTNTTEKGPPPKKVRLKQEVLPKTKVLLRLEKFNFAFNEIEGSVGSWKHARLLADGTANINAANAQYFKERLEVCTAKIYENVMLDNPNMEKYKVRMYFCADPVKLKALVECLICQKSIQVSYKQKNGKFKQWINSNVLRHVETLHKSKKKGGVRWTTEFDLRSVNKI